MHIDPFSIVIFTVIMSLLMSAGLFVVSRAYLTDLRGISDWTKGLLLTGIGWSLFALYKIIPHLSMVMGTVVGLASLVFYFRALVAFKELNVSVRWLYILVTISFLVQVYFVNISFNIVAKIVVTSLSVAILLVANSFLLLTKQHGVCPRSHRLTAAFFIFASCVHVIRAIYYLVWNTQPEQTLLQHNIIQDITYLTHAIFMVGTSFGFALMCNEKYLTEKNQAQLDLKKSVSLLNTILESTADALLAVDLTGKITKYNSLFVKMWAIPEPMINTKSDELLLNFVLSQLVDKESFINEVINSYKHLHDNTFSELHFNDGRIIERYSRPQYLNDEPVGRVWSFRDVTERKRMEQQLRDSENRFRILFEDAPLSYQSLDIEGNFLSVNQAWLDMVGCQLKDVIGRFFGDFMTESSKLLVTQTFSQFKKEGYISSPIFELVRRDTGEERLVTVNGRISRDAQGLFQHTHCILIDVTEQYRLEVELKESEFRWKFAIEGAGDGVWDWNIETDEATYSKRWKEMLGYDETDILSLNDEWAMRIYPDDRSYVVKNMQDYLQGKTEIYVVEYRLKCKDDSYKWILGRGMVVSRGKDGQPLRMIGTHTDITERKAAEEEIKQLAFFDPLTGLPNRRKLSDRLHYSIAINRRNHSQFAVFMMDLDKFKAVNDKLGHAAGDELLKQVAARIINCLRESDMVARLGGDEFVLVLENLKLPEMADIIALKVIASLTLPFQLSNNHTVQIGASIGISIYPQDGNTSEKLMDHADTALYQAKDNGRGCFAYFSEVSSTINNV